MKVIHIGQLIGGLDVYIRNTITYADEDIDYVIVRGGDSATCGCKLRYLTVVYRNNWLYMHVHNVKG